LATASPGFFIHHHRGPGAKRIDIAATFVEKTLRVCFQQPRRETLANQSTLAVTAVGVESVADHRAAVDFDVGNHSDQAGSHFAEIDIGVADRRGDRFGDFANINDTDHARVPGKKLRCRL
jgi:hypothetical protein